MRIIYSFLAYLIMPFIFLKLLRKAYHNPDYAKRWRERLGKVPANFPQHVIWWHCVSVGETLASVKLIQAFQKKYPDMPVVVTTMTPSGSAQVNNRLGESVYHMYIPYDFAYCIKKFIQRIKPRLCVIMETELWPNTLYYCQKLNVPVLLANARLSEKSEKGYARFLAVTRPMINQISLIAVQNKTDGQRFLNLGLAPKKLIITGSLKFDIDISQDLIQSAQNLRKKWGAQRSVWIAASTHEGEEEIIVDAAKKIPEALLILAPRHPERATKIVQLCKNAGLSVCLRSSNQLPDKHTQVFLINTLGELMLFYAASDIAFVGNSLISGGGHNLLEPAALGMPILSGESLHNFAEIDQLLTQANALIKINNTPALIHEIRNLLENIQQAKQMGESARQMVLKNKGALQKHLDLIDKLLH